ncbi:MAG: hypothetical protein ACREOC_12460 [Gemmatimonadales bacterium]
MPSRTAQGAWPAWQPWAALAGFAFLVHFVWEMWQAPFYRTMLDADHVTAVRTCTIATIGDAAITLVAFAAGAWLSGGRPSLAYPSLRFVAVYIAAGIAATVLLEWLNVYVLERWTYAHQMPTILGLGLTPLIQWLLLPPLVLWLAARHLGLRPRSID